MRPAIWIAPIAGIALAASVAEASQHTLTFTITNNTSTPWLEVIFEIRPPRGVQYDPAQYALVQFMVDPARHDTTLRPVDIFTEQPTNQALHFDYSEHGMMTQASGPVQFTMMIDNPSGMDFRVGYRKVLLPAPGTAALMLAAGAFASRRRRPA